MKTFFEKLTTVPFPAARISAAAASRSDKVACCAKRRAASRAMGWRGVCMGRQAVVRKEFNTVTRRGGDGLRKPKRRISTQRLRRGVDQMKAFATRGEKWDYRKRSSTAGRMMRAAGSSTDA